MKLIAVTQRVEVTTDERRDALDQRWSTFLNCAGLSPIAIPNDRQTARLLWQALPFAGLLLTGGNNLVEYGGDAPERDETERTLLEQARSHGLPVIGVCRGMQLLQAVFEVPLGPVSGHVAQDHEITVDGVLLPINSYHSLGARQSASELRVLGRAADGVIKAVRHVREPIVGLMWHPERRATFHEWDVRLFQHHYGVSP
ncbi:MAG: gamma-glutamyl-gamma-aminobutyrate hydrolase family protein [Bradyrhizobium sp.]|uniref:gamma-glutamyl-gamma-aminobutyrate hydrolase family protein n=1 Tax=Bradyrhizobium sp. TaxID=376 RepID=UPI001DE8E9DB|nr:gamma-glutamyl-gamma-aminobutyrate hydrolase family protein [Bradyrhizobium sp.]MBV9563481.1 gamma-glutamyl-gamma-aminobutyrate hydrolase family protein [Bradyrhizobium sp.]